MFMISCAAPLSPPPPLKIPGSATVVYETNITTYTFATLVLQTVHR